MKENLYPRYPVLLVDDEEHVLDFMNTFLRTYGINNIIICHDSRGVEGIVASREIEVILLDLAMPYLPGEDLLAILSRDFPDVYVIVITGSLSIDKAVECMKAGAFDYMVKPFEQQRLVSVVKRAIELRELRRENRLLKAHVFSRNIENPEAFSDIVTNNDGMLAIFQYIEATAESPKPILITGESGVGKELVARSIHTLSKRKGAFVAVNVAGLDDNIFADTLFGHLKGAFTGAERIRAGLIEKAIGGTLFLDEIGDMTPASQIKLLRLIQEREFYPLGSDTVKQSDARLIVSTNKDIHAMQESAEFRKDLYYRLSTHHIHIPPLRERPDDLPILIDHFIGEAAEVLKKKKPAPSKELFTFFSKYHYPGNIRELQSLIFDAVSREGSGKLSISSFESSISRERPLPTDIHTDQPNGAGSLISFSQQLPTLTQSAQLLIDEALKRAGGNQSVAAGYLGISQQALSQRLKKNKH